MANRATKRRPSDPADVTTPVPESPREIEYIEHKPGQLGSGLVDPAAQLLTVPEAAQLLRLSRATVYVLLQRGELPSFKIGVTRRISLAALQEYLRSTASGW